MGSVPVPDPRAAPGDYKFKLLGGKCIFDWLLKVLRQNVLEGQYQARFVTMSPKRKYRETNVQNHQRTSRSCSRVVAFEFGDGADKEQESWFSVQRAWSQVSGPGSGPQPSIFSTCLSSPCLPQQVWPAGGGSPS